MQSVLTRLILPLILSIFTASASHAVEVVFLELRTRDGQLIQLEPGGRFGHVAIRFGRHWLHAHPHNGVELVEDLGEYGHPVFVLINPRIPDPDPEEVAEWLGKPFDRNYRWDNPRATYCTRLVANLLGVDPTPMTFSAPVWSNHVSRQTGELGLSPDELFGMLLTRGYQPVLDCASALEFNATPAQASRH